MVQDHKKSESNSESEIKRRIEVLENTVDMLLEVNKALRGEIEAMQRGDNTGEKHILDGGYFD